MSHPLIHGVETQSLVLYECHICRLLLFVVTSQCGQVDDIDYRKESERLKSFANWPSYVTAQPEELAKCGFYYLGPDDRVQCAFCKGILRCWEPADTPMGEHRRHFPECPFLTDQQSVGNIPLRDVRVASTQSEDDIKDVLFMRLPFLSTDHQSISSQVA